jgi:hypothetical protein
MKDWHEKPPPEARSVNDALKDAVRLRRELPLTVQVQASDWDKVILADELLRVRAKLTAALNMHLRHSEDAWRGLNASQGHVCYARQELEAIQNRAEHTMKTCKEWE